MLTVPLRMNETLRTLSRVLAHAAVTDIYYFYKEDYILNFENASMFKVANAHMELRKRQH